MKKHRQSVMWTRFNVGGISNLGGTVQGSTIVDPVGMFAEPTFAFAQKHYLKRIKLDLSATINLATSAVGLVEGRFGMYLSGLGEPIRNPTNNTLTDSRVEWLDTWIMYWKTTATTGIYAPEFGLQTSFVRDVRVEREINMDQVVVLSFIVFVVAGAITFNNTGVVSGACGVEWLI